ncbi:hypothetical protein BYT27DRAFT_7205991, partial [Phlegmacium glaucopus]
MALFTAGTHNIVINSSSFNDVHGNVHSYNSIHATNVDSFNHSIQATSVNSFNISNPVNVHSTSPQPQGYTDIHSRQSTDVSTPSSSSTGNVVNYAAIDQNIEQFISHTVGGVPDALEIEDASEIEEIDDVEDAGSDDDHSRPINRTYKFRNVQTVYINAFNARGVRVKNAGNHAPQVTHHDETIVVRPRNDKSSKYINEGSSSRASSSKPPQQMPALSQLFQYQDVPPDSASESGSPPVIPLLPFQLREDSQPAQSEPLSVPAIEIPAGSRSNNPFLNQFMVVPPADIPSPTFEEGQALRTLRKSDKLSATSGTTMMPENEATNRHYTPKTPAPATLPGPEFQPFPVNPFLPIHMGLHPSLFLPPILPPLPGAAQNASPNNITVDKWNDTFSQPKPPPHHHS